MTVRRAGKRALVMLLGLLAIGGTASIFATVVPEPPDPLPGGGTCPPSPPPLPAPNSLACTSHQFARKVLAYHMADKPVTAAVPWAHLTNLTDFAVAATSTGTLVEAYQFNFCDLQKLVIAGHDECVQVGLTLVAEPNLDDTIFKDTIHAFLASPTARDRLIANLLGNLYYANADGIDVDIEFPRTCNTNSPEGCVDDGQAYVDFVAALTAQVHAWKPGSYVYVTVPQWDYAGLQTRYHDLAAVSDGLQIMGYGYHSAVDHAPPSGHGTDIEHTPGPTSPIHSGAGTVWPSIGMVTDDLNKTFEYYHTVLGIPSSKLMMGYPFSGTEYPATSSSIPSDYDWNSVEKYWYRSLADPTAATDCDREFATGYSWDPGSKTPYKVFQGTYGPRQLFCENKESLTHKLDLAICKNAAGVFYWAENHITADHDFWTVVDKRLKLPVEVPPTDTDGDGVADECDNCPTVPNAAQSDADADTVGDACDNCRWVSNTDQQDANANGIGDACIATRLGAWTTGPTHANAAGRDRLLVFMVGYENSKDLLVKTVSYGGQSLIRVNGAVVAVNPFERIELWYLKEAGIAAASNATFVVTYGSSSPANQLFAAATYANVDQTAPILNSGVNTTTTSTPISVPIGVSADGMAIGAEISGNVGAFTWSNAWTKGTDQSASSSQASTADHPATAGGADSARATVTNQNRAAIVAISLAGAPQGCTAVVGGDVDGDGVCGAVDNCPTTPNANQYDCNDNGQGDLCDVWCSKLLHSIATEDGEIKNGATPNAGTTTMRVSAVDGYRSVISFYSPFDPAGPLNERLPAGAVIKGAKLTVVEDQAMTGTQPPVTASIKRVTSGSGAFSANNTLQKADWTDTNSVSPITGTFTPVTPGSGAASQLALDPSQFTLLDRSSNSTARIQFRLETTGTGTARWLTGNFTASPAAQPTLELLYSAP